MDIESLKRKLLLPGILLILTGGTSNIAYSQTDDMVKPVDIISPSPVAAALFKSVNVPIGYYTGTPDIEVPIYTIKTGSIAMPITMKYNAIGIRVEEEAGLTGLGWDLQTGGAIGRSVIGKPDEAPLNDPNGAGYRASAAYLQMPQSNSFATNSWLSGLSTCVLKLLSEGKFYELTPDNYYMHFNGHSARLFFDMNDHPYFSPNHAWKLSGNEQTGFTVVTEDGVTYVFDLAESTHSTSETLPADVISQTTANTSWYLTSIISANKTDTLTISYQPVMYNVTAHNPMESRSTFLISQAESFQGCNTEQPNSVITEQTTYDQTIYGYVIKSISTRDTRVDFNISEGRSDIPDSMQGMPYKLDSVVIYNSMSGWPDRIIKKFIYNYDYFTNAAAGSPAISQRLRLLSIQEMDGNQKTGQLYKFDYNSTTALPNKDSKAQDSWGYYNSADGNTTLIPAFTDDHGVFYSGGDRGVNETDCQAGMLTRITYPTGGYSSFEYESNRYESHLPTGDSSINTVTQTISVAYANSSPTSKSATFTIPYDQYVSFSITINEIASQAGEAEADLLDGSANLVFSTTTIGTTTLSRYLTAGTYTITVSKDAVTTQSSLMVLNYQTHVASPVPGVAAGGVRIKRMVQSDGIKSSISNFQYLNGDSTSSGSLLNTPVYTAYTYTPVLCGIFGQAGYWLYFSQHSTPTMDLGRTQGGCIGYSKVKVLYGDNGENGSEELTFSATTDPGGDGFPYAPKTSLDDFRGLLLQKKTYSSAGTLLEQMDNQYNTSHAEDTTDFREIFGVKVGALRTAVNNLDANGCPLTGGALWDFETSQYSVFQLWPTLAVSSKTTYSQQGAVSITTTTGTGYDSVNLQPINKWMLSSKGDSLTTRLKYAIHFAGTPVYDSMIGRNMINVPIETDKFKNTNFLEKLVTNFQSKPVGGKNLLLPLNEQVQVYSNPLEAIIFFTSYDGYGNLLAQSKSSDVVHSYVWDYKATLPIAEAINALPGDIASTSFESDGGGNWTGINAANIQSDSNSITGFNDYLLTGTTLQATVGDTSGYVVSYWSKNGSFSVNGGPGVSGRTVSINGQQWTYFEHSVGGETIAVSGTGVIDELRLYPANAQMTTYTYQPLVGITSLCDINNRITYYEYDGLGRLSIVRDQDRNILRKICYNYAGQTEDCYVGASCSSFNCPAPGNKCIAGTCQAGVKVYTSSESIEGLYYICTYHYEFSDGSWSDNFSETSSTSCPITISNN